MKRGFLLSLLAISLFVIADISLSLAYTELDTAAAIRAEGQISFTPQALLDNFDKGTGINLWNATTATVAKSGSGATIAASFSADPALTFGANDRSLQLDYNVNPADSWAAYVTSLGNGSISGYNYVSFWVKGSAGNELLKVEFHHANYDSGQTEGYNNNYKAEVYVTDYLDGGVTTSWKKVTIPLDAFANITDRTQVKEMVITFENSQSNINGSPKSGTVYIDNISFGKQFLGFLRIDHFGDKVSKNSLGGNCSSADPAGQGTLGTFTYTNTTNQYLGFANGLDFHFQNVQDPNYYAYVSTVGGGDSGNVAQPRNFSAYNNIAFSCRSSADNVRCLKMELHCPTSANNYFHFFKYTFTNTSWTPVTVPLTEFTTNGWAGQGTSIVADGKTSSVGEIVFTRDGWMSYWSGDWDYGVYTGDFYIDKVQFEITGYSPDTAAPAQPSTLTTAVSGSIVTLTSAASSRSADSSMENVGFEYYSGSIWKAIGYDYDTSDGTYTTKWDVSGLTPGTYQIRSVAMDASGNKSTARTATYTK